jgi:hypothetical protein
LKPRRVNFKPVLHRPVELAPFLGQIMPRDPALPNSP